MPDISISIVTHNSSNTIVQTLYSLIEHKPHDLTMQIYIIDNASSDQTLELIRRFSDPIIILESLHSNIGFGAAHNLVLPYLSSNIHIIMNPDIWTIDDTSIPALYQYLMHQPDTGMVVPRIVDKQGKMQYLCRRNLTVLDLLIRGLPDRWFRQRRDFHMMKDHDYGKSFDVPFASGCLMAIRSNLFRSLGGFDERYFMYAEDADLSRKINQISKVTYIPDAIFSHAWERASYRNVRMTFIHIRSLFLYFNKWGWTLK